MDRTPRHGFTPLMRAVLNCSSTDRLERLIKRGVDVNAKNIREENFTALHYAAGMGSLSAVRKLVNMGADVNAKSRSGQTPLDIAKEMGNSKTVRVLSNNFARSRRDEDDKPYQRTPEWLSDEVTKDITKRSRDFTDLYESIYEPLVEKVYEGGYMRNIKKEEEAKLDRESEILEDQLSAGNENLQKIMRSAGLMIDTTTEKAALYRALRRWKRNMKK